MYIDYHYPRVKLLGLNTCMHETLDPNVVQLNDLGSPSEFSLDKNLLVNRVLTNFVRNMKIFAKACELITMICEYVVNPKGLLNVFHVGIHKMLIYENNVQ